MSYVNNFCKEVGHYKAQVQNILFYEESKTGRPISNGSEAMVAGLFWRHAAYGSPRLELTLEMVTGEPRNKRGCNAEFFMSEFPFSLCNSFLLCITLYIHFLPGVTVEQ